MDKTNELLLDELASPPLRGGGFSPELQRRIAGRLAEEEQRIPVVKRRLALPLSAVVCAAMVAAVIWLLPDSSPTVLEQQQASGLEPPAQMQMETVERLKLRSGLLLGLRRDGATVSGGAHDAIVSESAYRTLWIAQDREGLVIRQEGSKLLIPYKQDFWLMEPVTTAVGDDVFHRLVTNKAGETAVAPSLQEDPDVQLVYSEQIDFAGNQFVALTVTEERLASDNHLRNERVMVERLDDLRAGREAPLPLGQFTDETDKATGDTRNWTLLRNNGGWVAHVDVRKLPSEPLQLQPVVPSQQLDGALTAFDQLCMPWERILELDPAVTDAVCSPSADMLALIGQERISIYTVDQEGVYGDPLQIELQGNEQMVMAQWAMDQYVDKWDELARELLK